MSKDRLDHGETLTHYNEGCRCDPCRELKRAWNARRSHQSLDRLKAQLEAAREKVRILEERLRKVEAIDEVHSILTYSPRAGRRGG